MRRLLTQLLSGSKGDRLNHAKPHPVAQTDNLKWPLCRLLVCEKYKLLYCPIGKNANTFMKSTFLRLCETREDGRMPKNIHKYLDRGKSGIQIRDFSVEKAASILSSESFFKFAVLRDPIDRTISAYWEKFVLNRRRPGNQAHTRQIVEIAQKSRQDRDLDFEKGISFKQFVKGVTSLDPAQNDPHWRPQYLYLEGVKYDAFYLIEDMNALLAMLEKRTGHKISREPKNVSGSGIGGFVEGAADLLPVDLEKLGKVDRGSFLTPELLDDMRYYFAKDFELLKSAAASR